ncbi:hypothetical protein GQ457_01G008400 [Hibiscus cannabinus]
MFRCIAGAIGTIIKIDYNTSEAEVCKPHDEKEIERSCVDDGDFGEKFGPWMLAPTRKLRRATGARNATTSNGRNNHPSEGTSGKFDLLNTIVVEDEDTGIAEPVIGEDVSVPTSLVEAGEAVGDKLPGYKENSEGGRTMMMEEVTDSNNSTREVIVPSKVSLNSNNHVAVRVVERGSEILPEKAIGRKAVNVVNAVSTKSGHPLSVGKTVARKGTTFKHKQQHRGPTQVTLGDWIGNLSREISSGIVQGDKSDSDPRVGSVRSDSDVHWKVNTAFDPGLPQ